MHPDLLRALAQAKHEDLLNDRRPRGSRHPRRVRTDGTPRFARSRRRVGALLIWAGARVMGDQRTSLELARD